jgi:PPOX class probable F420-dependent enzyme
MLDSGMADIADFRKLIAGEHGLVVVSTLREDGTIASSVVNAGVLAHPVTGETVVGMVLRGGIRKLRHLRERPRVTVAVRVGWQWATAEGPVDIMGPEDPFPGIDAERLRRLLREIFIAAGGTHEDFDEYDRVMKAESRTAVLVRPEKVYSNPTR